MSKRIDENRIRALVRLGVKTAPVPEKTEARILGEIRARTAARPRRSILTLLRYQPALTFAVLVIVFLPLLIVLGGTLFSPGGVGGPLTVASDKGGTLTGRTESLRFGEVIGEKDVIRTGPGEQTALLSPGRIGLQLFSNSEIQISVYNEHNITVALRRGSLYVHKIEKTEADRLVRLTVDLYLFTLKGTRVYAAVHEDRRITLICFDGLMEVATDSPASGGVLFSLTTGERAVIAADGTWQKDSSGLSDAEQALDETLNGKLPRTQFVSELNLALYATFGPGPAPEDEAPEVPPYDITAVGSIAARGPDGGVAFYASAAAGGRVFLVNRENVFTLEKTGVKLRTGLVPDASFRVRPVAAGTQMAFSTPGAVVLVDTAALKTTAVLPLPSEGTIDHNFTPRFANDILYVPVQNQGYYKLSTVKPAALALFTSEPFPLSPLPMGGKLFIGSYYGNYFGAVDAAGKTIFKTALKGNAFTNIAAAGDSFFLYQEEGSAYALVRMDEAGRETGRFPLAHAVTADFTVVGGLVCGIYTDGTLFVADPASGKTVPIRRLFHTTLSSRQWRNAGLAAAGRLLYAPTDDGKILIVNPKRKAVEDEIIVPGNEAFYTAPFLYENAVYAVANSGTVYRMIKNAQ